ncbi:hypothetical protein C5L33_000018 [Lactobacillus pasteurii]|uniref:mucin-binding protein n=1 Tax=Lactobacillus pasteurii TaxID=872327 RepID=UPI0009E7B033|nr:YSIRK-type signal peptide-containing protein [Lactobacillus pasteurii]TDG77794.1 hypothetical protein C5L33_000018 [Lactobacillus pasteurii]
MFEKRPKYTLRKLSVGLASVMIGSTVLMVNSPKVHAGTVDSSATQIGDVEKTTPEYQAGKTKKVSESGTTGEDTKNSKPVVTSSNLAETTTPSTEKKEQTKPDGTPVDPNQKGSSETQAKRTKAFAITPAAAPAAAQNTQADDDFTMPKASTEADSPIENRSNATEPVKNSTGEFQIWISGTGKDGKEYNSGLIGDNTTIVLDASKLDLDTVSYNLIYENKKGDNIDPGFYTSMNDKVATYGDILMAKKKSGDQVTDVKIPSYSGNSNDRINLWNLKTNLGDKLRIKAKINYVNNGSLTFIPGAATYYYAVEGYHNLIPAGQVSVSFINGPENIEKPDNPTETGNIVVDKPSTSMTDPETDTNPLLYGYRDKDSLDKNSNWYKITTGQVAEYLRFRGKDGKEYTTRYLNEDNHNQFLIDTTKLDPNSLEMIVVYQHQTDDTKKNPMLWFSFGDSKQLSVDTRRVDAKTGFKVEDSLGKKHDLKYMLPSDAGKYKTYDEYLEKGGKLEDVKNLYFNDGGYEKGETIKVTIPLKFNGYASGENADSGNISVTDYNTFTTKRLFVRFAQPLFKISNMDQKVTARVMGHVLTENGKGQTWVLQPEADKWLEEAGITGKDLFIDDPTYTYKLDYIIYHAPDIKVTPKDNLSMVYTGGGFVISLRKAQDVLSKHGYSVQFAKSNKDGSFEAMPYYLYDKIDGAIPVDHDDDNVKPNPNTPSTGIKMYISVIPTILVNPDLHYTVGDKVKDVNGNETTDWDPLNEGKPDTNKDALLKAYNDAGYDSFKQRNPGDFFGVIGEKSLTALNPRGGDKGADGVDNPGLTVTIVYQASKDAKGELVDKVDLTKAGIYTVTYSRVFFGPQTRPDNSLINLIAINGGKQGEMILNQGKVYVDPAPETETKQVTRTINYVEDGNESNVLHDPTVQTVTFTRTKSVDIETGKISYTDWTAKDGASFAEVTAPTIPGYTATQAKVDAQAVTVDSENVTVKVTYKKNQTPVKPVTPDNPDTTTDTEHIVIPKDQDKDNGSKDNGNKDADSSDTTKQVEHLTNKENGKQEVQKLSTSPVSENQANAQLPQTGEKNNLATALIAAGLGLTALAGMLFFRKKN